MSEITTRPLALVTGASSGIGKELARELVENGYDVVVAAEDERVNTVALELSGAEAYVTAVQVDLRDYDQVEELARRVEDMGRPLAVAAINAGVGVGGAFVENDLARELDLIDLNITSTVHLAKLVAAPMSIRGEGKILFTSSVASQAPSPFQAVYAASKAFVQSFSESLRDELKDAGVSVTAVLPGPTDTEFFDRAGLDDTKMGSDLKKDDPAVVAKQAVKALEKGKDSVNAGSLASKAQAVLGHVVPDSKAAASQHKLNEPGSAKDA